MLTEVCGRLKLDKRKKYIKKLMMIIGKIYLFNIFFI